MIVPRRAFNLPITAPFVALPKYSAQGGESCTLKLDRRDDFHSQNWLENHGLRLEVFLAERTDTGEAEIEVRRLARAECAVARNRTSTGGPVTGLPFSRAS